MMLRIIIDNDAEHFTVMQGTHKMPPTYRMTTLKFPRRRFHRFYFKFLFISTSS